MHHVEAGKVNKPIRVLLVDDDEDYFVLTRALFSDIQDQSYELDWVTSYDTALAALQSAPYDVCLLDYQLDEHDGVEVLREAHARGHRLPMIMLTGHGNRQVDLEAMTAGAADYLHKATTDAELLERSIRYAIDRVQITDKLRDNEARIAALYAQEQSRAGELEHTHADLRRAEIMRDDLAHLIVYDLRGLLTAIRLNLDLVMTAPDQPPEATAAPYLMNMRMAADRMAWMIEDLLNVSMLEAGEMPLHLSPVAVPQLLAEKQAAYHAQLDAERKTFTIHAPADLPAIMLDADLIGRVLDNLIRNAIRFTQAGSHIDITAEANDQAVTMRVHDDGEVMRSGYHEHIFDKLTRDAATTTLPTRQDTGVGLVFCHLAVTALGGTITATSEPDQGTAVTIRLPLSR
jgi:signal transduction histidine kinase